MREEHRLKIFENRVLRRIFGPKRVEGTREWRKLHNEDHNDLYSSHNIVWVIKKKEMGRACGASGGGERHMQGFGGET